MIPGSEKLQSVTDELIGWDGDRDAVQRAAETFWSAAPHAREWPEPVRAWHERISSMLFSQGVVRDTVARMTHVELTRLVSELNSFTSEILRSRCA